MAALSDRERYISLSTRKRDGSFVDTPVWFAQAATAGRFYVFSLRTAGKVKRIRNFPEVRVAPCTYKGKLKGDWQQARAVLVDDPAVIEEAYKFFRAKYGLTFRISDFFSRLVGNYQRRQFIQVELNGTSS